MSSGYYYSALKQSLPSFANQYSMDFDGVNDYVHLGNDNSDLQPTGAFSLSVWVKFDGLSGIQGIWEATSNVGVFGNDGYIIWKSSANKFQFYIRQGASWKIASATTTVTTGTWYHILCTWDGSTTSKIFINGIEEGSQSVTSINYNVNTGINLGGYQSESITKPYQIEGNIDEASLFNSVVDITDLWNGSGTPTDLTSLNPLKWYRMGENAVFRDPQWLLPSNENKDNYSNYSLDFDGVNDSISFITPKDIGETPNISYSVWVNLDVTTKQYIAGNWISSNGGTGLTIQTGDVLIFQMADGTNDSFFNSRVANFSTYAPINTWNHILATWDGTDSKIYINGVLRNTWTPPGGYTISGYSTTGFKIGWRGQLANSTNGKLDEIGVFDSGVSIGDVWDGSGKPIDISTVSGITHNWRLGEDATFDGTNWTFPDIVGSKPGTSANMDISDRAGDAPGSANNAISFNMDRFDKVEDVPT